MKVYVGYECYYDYCNVWKEVTKIFDDEVKALIWHEQFIESDTHWREYKEVTVE